MLISMAAPPPTQRDLARRLQLSQSCISQALRGSRRIAAVTRQRVRTEAAAAGYLPDPALAALARRRWAKPRSTVVAFLGSRTAGRDRYLDGVRRRCAELGLPLWHLPRSLVDDDEKAQRALDRRRVGGVIVGQATRFERPRRLAWDRLRAVHCGLLMLPESGDIVCPNLLTAVVAAWQLLQARGFRRVAAIMPFDPRYQSEVLLVGALLALERTLGDGRLRVWTGARQKVNMAHRWLQRRPTDAILGYDHDLWDELRRMGTVSPYAALTASPDRPDVAGFRSPYAAVASAAVDLIADRLRVAPGPPSQRRLHLIEMEWVDGGSLPP